MAEYTNITRRAAIVGAIASTTAIGAATVALAKQIDEPGNVDDLIQHHAQRLAAALCRKHGGLWQFSVHSAGDASAFLFTRSRSDVAGTLQTF